MADTLAAYRRLLVAQVRSQTQYRASFALDLAGNAAFVVLDIASVLVLFRITPALGGFGTAEVLLVTGFGSLGFALADLAVGNVERLRGYVRTGLLDAVLVRPLTALGQLVVLDFQPRRIGSTVQSLVVLVSALLLVDVPWTPARAALVVLAPLAGAVLFGAVFVATSAVTFWWVESVDATYAFTNGGRQFTMVPLTVYPDVFRRLFGYALGFGFVAYYPALALLGRPDPLGAPGWVAWCAPLVAVPACAVAALVWRTGVRHYRSTGS